MSSTERPTRKSGEFASQVTFQLVGAGETTSVLYIRKFGPHMYGTP